MRLHDSGAPIALSSMSSHGCTGSPSHCTSSSEGSRAWGRLSCAAALESEAEAVLGAAACRRPSPATSAWRASLISNGSCFSSLTAAL